MNKPLITIDPAALKRMMGYQFPGNIRELENMVERAIVVGNGKKIMLRDLPLGKDVIDTTVESLDEFEKAFILQILNKYSWNISRTAQALKVDRVTLYNQIKKYGLKAWTFKPGWFRDKDLTFLQQARFFGVGSILFYKIDTCIAIAA